MATGAPKYRTIYNISTETQHIFILSALGMAITDPEPWVVHMVNEQKPDGSWGIANELEGNISLSVEAYFALKLLGLLPTHPALEKARECNLGMQNSDGGGHRIRIRGIGFPGHMYFEVSVLRTVLFRDGVGEVCTFFREICLTGILRN